MSQDPNQPPTGYGSDPQNPYGAPPPQNPYGTPQQGTYGPAQQSSYGTPQQGPYGPPPQGPYGAPQQNPYGPGPQMQAGYAAPAAGFAFNTPAGPQVPLQPLPLGDAVQQLPNQYINVVTHPAEQTFAAELPKSNWDITWIQLLIWAVAAAVIGLITSLFATAFTAPLMGNSMSGLYSSILVSTSVGSALLRIIFVPIGFFILAGIQYLVAKAFKGQGTFLTQAYTMLLYEVPINILRYLIALVFGLIPVVGFGIAGLLSLALWVYSVVLNVYQIRASHRLSTGQSVVVALTVPVLVLVLSLICGLL